MTKSMHQDIEMKESGAADDKSLDSGAKQK
jgi:hypothetical protein